jgi:hypothetical protein
MLFGSFLSPFGDTAIRNCMAIMGRPQERQSIRWHQSKQWLSTWKLLAMSLLRLISFSIGIVS